jgi:hypothetical protein
MLLTSILQAHIERALHDHFLFRKLTDTQCHVLLDCMQRVEVQPGEVVVKQASFLALNFFSNLFGVLKLFYTILILFTKHLGWKSFKDSQQFKVHMESNGNMDVILLMLYFGICECINMKKKKIETSETALLNILRLINNTLFLVAQNF